MPSSLTAAEAFFLAFREEYLRADGTYKKAAAPEGHSGCNEATV
jgi:hypothetical protein